MGKCASLGLQKCSDFQSSWICTQMKYKLAMAEHFKAFKTRNLLHAVTRSKNLVKMPVKAGSLLFQSDCFKYEVQERRETRQSRGAILYVNLKWRAKFQISQLRIRDTVWLNFIHFSGYTFKIRLVLILRKRVDQALISISTILKLSTLF